MCDEFTEADLDRAGLPLRRRDFGALMGVGAVAAMLPAAACAAGTIKGRDVTITTDDGTVDAYFVAPGEGKHPGVLMWPDIRGLRPAFRQMADRLAGAGYAVLCVNPFYRWAKAPVVYAGHDFDDPGVRDQRPLARRSRPREPQQDQGQSRDRGGFPGKAQQHGGGDHHWSLPSRAFAIIFSSSSSSDAFIPSCIPSSAAAALVADPLKKTRTTWLSADLRAVLSDTLGA